MTHISLEQIDRSGALRELADDAGAYDPAGTRRDVLRRAGLAGAGFVAGGVLFNGLLSPAEAASSAFTHRRSKSNDVRIANYALTLEYLEAEFYEKARDGGALRDASVKEFAKVVAAHERAHVNVLKGVLGRGAVKKPTFDFGKAVTHQATFLATAAAVEPVGVSAYAGAGPYILQLPILKAALSIHSVEAKHAGWVLALLKERFGGKALPAPDAFDVARSRAQVLKIVAGTGFIKG